MVRVVVLYGEAPDDREYEAHAELCGRVPGGTFRHGPVIGSPMGEPTHRYYAEWEFPDEQSFRSAAASEEFLATGKDAYKRGFPQPTVEFVSLG